MGFAKKSLPVIVAKTFYSKGGEVPLAISKQRKEEVLSVYADWLKRSQAVILV